MAPAAPMARAAARANPPVPVLRWHACADPAARGFQCAAARVPLDYADPAGRAIQLAVIRHRASQPARRIGSLFINFGGPAGAGVSDLPPMYHLVPAALRQRFDIISFDPRGAGESAPVNCFATAAAADRFFAPLPAGFPVGQAQRRQWISSYAALGRQCERRAGPLLPHLATADVARDMDLLRRAVGDPRMNYLGLSYGTYLGATYANLFPSDVRAMAFDGAIAPDAWALPQRAGPVPLSTWLRIRQDEGMRATLGQFLRLCGQASARRCAFSAGTARATSAKYAALLRRVRQRPVVITIAGQGRTTITYAGLVSLVGHNLYVVAPALEFRGWAYVGQVLEASWRASTASGQRPGAAAVRAPGSPAEPLPNATYLTIEQRIAIQCADSPNPRDPASYPAQAAAAYPRSGAFASYVTWVSEACATWPATDASGYYGPWNHPTASPVLVIGNLYDPATPYTGALALTSELAQARLLTVAGYGHTAFFNPSTCVDRYESAYFVSGAMPPTGTVCHQDQRPFAGSQRPA